VKKMGFKLTQKWVTKQEHNDRKIHTVSKRGSSLRVRAFNE